MSRSTRVTAEHKRLEEDTQRKKNWKRWGPYLPARQWSTVREDYSKGGDSWNSFDYEQARSRVFRWGEDGLLGWCDRQCRIALAPALWNGHDDHLKERLFGLTSHQGNHGEDVKELYFYLDSTPTHSYAKARYRYPHREFPYRELIEENDRRGVADDEYEIVDTGVFDHGFFELDVEYAKSSPNGVLIRYTVHNRGPRAPFYLLSQVWYRNVWKWGRQGEDFGPKPEIEALPGGAFSLHHEELGEMVFDWREPTDELLFTDNETDQRLLYGVPNVSPWVKNAFHRYLVEEEGGAVNPDLVGTKAGVLYRMELDPGESRSFDFYFGGRSEAPDEPFLKFDEVIERRRQEADEFYQALNPGLEGRELEVWRQAYAGLLWSKQFYYYAVKPWLEGDPTQPAPPPPEQRARNQGWQDHLYNRDVILMPDTWEYPWYAAWDLAFHAYPMARLDPHFAKDQLLLMLREWYMHPNGQLPAYEFDFSDVNPPVHAWACLRVYRATGANDTAFLERAFHKLLLNFTWWVNREDEDGDNVFSGGFLGLDNIGVFDRSRFPKEIGELKQADATSWMGFFGQRMLQMALELAKSNDAYEDIASKFFEHFVAITDSVNSDCGKGLWYEPDEFYYDFVRLKDGRGIPMRVRSVVGLLPLIAVEILEVDRLHQMTGFRKRMDWFLSERPGLAQHLTWSEDGRKILLSLCPKQRLGKLLQKMLDPDEFLSPFGLRSLSKAHEEEPFVLRFGGREFSVGYEPGESRSGMFGGNSNWRGPVWFPINYLLIDALKRYHAFFGESYKVPFPALGGEQLTLLQVARELESRLVSLFLPTQGSVPALAGLDDRAWWDDQLLFHEYFHAETGQGLGACHQTGWTSLVARCLEDLCQASQTRL